MGSTKILSEEALKAKFWSRVEVGKDFECWPWKGTQRTKQGYGQIGHNHKYPLAHRLAYIFMVGEIPDGLCVLHRCDNPPCCNPKHLFLGTLGENNTDRKNKGREGNRQGEKNGRAKLTAEMVRTLRTEHDFNGMSFESLAQKYRVAKVTIAKIVQRRLWKHVR